MPESGDRSWADLTWFLGRCPALLYRREAAADFTITFVSPGLTGVLGYTRADCLGAPRFWLDRVHPEDRVRVIAELDGLRGGRAVAHTYRFRHRDGSYRLVRDEVQLVRDASGGRGYFLGCLTVAGEPERPAASDGDADPGFCRVCEGMPDAVILHREGRLVYLNQRAVSELGYEHVEELIGREVAEITHADDRAAAAARLAASTSSDRGAVRHEVRLVRRDGSSWLVEVADGGLLHLGEPAVVTVARGVSARRKPQGGLLTTDCLTSMDCMAAAVAHEFGTPLAIVVAALNLAVGEVDQVLRGLGSCPAEGVVPATGQMLATRLAHTREVLREAIAQTDRVRQTVRDFRLAASAAGL